MDFVTIIKKKKNGEDLSEDEIRQFVLGSSSQKIHPAQIGAMLMAIALRGLTNKETYYFTRSIIESGRKLAWTYPTADKHSTGGVGDKVSIALVPALVAAGLRVPMVSGRSLDITGGTLDKLESIPGYNVELTVEKMCEIMEKLGGFISGTGPDFCPADKVLYGIRDTTATVDSNPLILGSILSKKIGEGVDFLVIDIKIGKAGIYKHVKDAQLVANEMVELSSHFSVATRVILTRMDEPIGSYAGNALEIFECLEVMKGKCVSDLKKLITYLGGELLCMSGTASSIEDGEKKIEMSLSNGEALKIFEKMLVYQNVEKDAAHELCYGDPWKVMKKSKLQTSFYGKSSGWVSSIDAFKIGEVIREMGGGRLKPNQSLDHSIGTHLTKKVGSTIKEGEEWLKFHHNTPLKKTIIEKIESAISISQKEVTVEDIIIDVIS